jgi:hypothetical protein
MSNGGTAEGTMTRSVESQTARVPSMGYLGAAIGSMAASAILKAFRKDQWSLFVGQWAPAFLILGLYNKLVKQHGSDRAGKGE